MTEPDLRNRLICRKTGRIARQIASIITTGGVDWVPLAWDDTPDLPQWRLLRDLWHPLDPGYKLPK